MKYKMYLVFATESVLKMKGNSGKLAAMAGHGFLHANWDSDARFPEHVKGYRDSEHAFKIALKVDTVAELETLLEEYKSICGVSLVKDKGFTVFEEPTIVCLGIGPLPEILIGETLKSLPLMK